MKHSFIDVKGPVTGERFIGRETETDEVMSHIRECPPSSCDILGLRRIGKTSLLLEVKRRLQQEEGGGRWIVLERDLSMYKNLEDPEARFYRNLIAQLDAALQREEDMEAGFFSKLRRVLHFWREKHSCLYDHLCQVFPPPGQGDGGEEAEFFAALLKQQFRRDNRKQVILFLDEFDACSKFERLSGFLGRLRAMLNARQEYGFCCVLATSRAIKMLEAKTSGDASNLNDALAHVLLRPFARETFETLCEQSVAAVDESDREAYYARAFGHPYLSGVLLHHHNKLRQGGGIPDKENVFRQAQADFEDYFAGLRKLFEEFPVGNDDCKRGIRNWFECLAWREKYKAKIPKYIVDTFGRYGFWKEEQATLPGALHEFVMRDTLDPWEEVGTIEVGLRRWIERELKKHYQDESEDWFMKMKLPPAGSDDSPWKEEEKRKNKSFQDIVHGWREDDIQKYPGEEAPHLDYTYLDDLMHIILIHWEVNGPDWKGFGAAFPEGKKHFKKMLRVIGDIRQPGAHFRHYRVVGEICRPGTESRHYPGELMAKFAEPVRYLKDILDRVDAQSQD